jgi:hypothetical protein
MLGVQELQKEKEMAPNETPRTLHVVVRTWKSVPRTYCDDTLNTPSHLADVLVTASNIEITASDIASCG